MMMAFVDQEICHILVPLQQPTIKLSQILDCFSWPRDQIHYRYRVSLFIALHLVHWCALFWFEVEHFWHVQLESFFTSLSFFPAVWIVPTAGFWFSAAAKLAKKSTLETTVTIGSFGSMLWISELSTTGSDWTTDSELLSPWSRFCFLLFGALFSFASFLLSFLLDRLEASSDSDVYFASSGEAEYFLSSSLQSPTRLIHAPNTAPRYFSISLLNAEPTTSLSTRGIIRELQ